MNQEYKMTGDNQEVSTKGQVKRQFTIREMVIIGLLSAVVITLGMTPFGLIRLGALNATTMHIPVLIGALDLYQNLGLNIFEYTFEEHDETVAYSLSIPFVSTFYESVGISLAAFSLSHFCSLFLLG